MTERVPSSGPIELPYLETFARAAELGSFTAAAECLGVTQAAVSQRIAMLERTLGVALFDRHARKVSLTSAGCQLYDFTRQILRLHHEARRALGSPQPEITGELSLAASSIPGEYLLPAMLSEFRQQFSHVQVRATVGDSSSVLQAVLAGEVMLGFIGREVDDPHLESRALEPDRLVLIVPPKHPWSRRDSVSLDELRAEPLILRETGSGSRWNLQKSLEQVGFSLDELNVSLELGSNAAIKDAVRRGLGVAFLSERAVQQDLDIGQLRSVEVQGLNLSRNFYVILDRRRRLSPPAQVFLQFLESRSAQSGTGTR